MMSSLAGRLSRRRDFELRLLLLFFALIVAFSSSAIAQDESRTEPISFSKQVLPILSNKCYVCHGPDENTRQAGLRLDVREEVFDSGVIEPGDVDASDLVMRISSDEEGFEMPPRDAGIERLTKQEVKIIEQWIREGAAWETHWAFVTPVKPELPKVDNESWVRNPIDRFVLAKLENEKIQPSKQADHTTLMRRTSLLLTGLPASSDQMQRFDDLSSPDTFAEFADELLASPAYGERMAAGWMDVARYSDSDGFQQDEPRTNWPWRDWVIDAYNSNKPFDEFTIEQFAGDLLPDATEEQILATCFHRNHMTNGEGGRDPEESRVDYVLDRVNTVGTTWLGLTLGCAQCHSHKYDPITQKEYYQLTAFFNSIDEDGRAGKGAKPYLQWPITDVQLQLAGPKADVEKRGKELANQTKAAQDQFESWLNSTLANRNQVAAAIEKTNWKRFVADKADAEDKKVELKKEEDEVWRVVKGVLPHGTYKLTGPANTKTLGAIRVEALPHKSFTAGGLAKSNSGNFVLTDVNVELVSVDDNGKESRRKLPFDAAWADYSQPGFDVSLAIDDIVDTGWAVWSGDMKQPRTAIFRLKESVQVNSDDRLEIHLDHYSHHPNHTIGRFRISTAEFSGAQQETDVTKLLDQIGPTDQPDDSQREELRKYFIDHDGKVGLAQALLNRAEKNLKQANADSRIPVMVLKERTKPRETYVLERGVWDAHGDKVERDTPVALSPKMPDSESRSRLDLAKWLVDPKNPLTARVTVNRYWQMYFGAGLVRTPEDFGLQGEQPTHPRLLDWLACEFIDSGWDIKHIQKLIVSSATFQQSSIHRQDLKEIDPSNRLLARGPRFRMPAAMIRDNALAVSGLLSKKLGGPPVKPYQPKNVWAASDQGKYPYVLSSGEDLYRRSIYTYWRRNISPPGMFDAAQRRVCEVTFRRTNSPIHALTLLNDVTYIETARALAQLLVKKGLEDGELIDGLFTSVLLRSASQRETDRLQERLNQLQLHFEANPVAAKELLAVGASEYDESLTIARLAATTVVASIILNLDESLNVE